MRAHCDSNLQKSQFFFYTFLCPNISFVFQVETCIYLIWWSFMKIGITYHFHVYNPKKKQDIFLETDITARVFLVLQQQTTILYISREFFYKQIVGKKYNEPYIYSHVQTENCIYFFNKIDLNLNIICLFYWKTLGVLKINWQENFLGVQF